MEGGFLVRPYGVAEDVVRARAVEPGVRGVDLRRVDVTGHRQIAGIDRSQWHIGFDDHAVLPHGAEEIRRTKFADRIAYSDRSGGQRRQEHMRCLSALEIVGEGPDAERTGEAGCVEKVGPTLALE